MPAAKNNRNNNKNKARTISYTGIFLALNILILALLNILPHNKLALLCISSLFPAMILIEFGYKTSITYNIAQILLGLIVVTNKPLFIAYILSMAIYGLYKSVIENKVQNIIVEYALKIAYCTLSFIMIYSFTKLFVELKPIYLYFGAYLVAYIAYDFAYSYFVKLYLKYRTKIIKGRLYN